MKIAVIRSTWSGWHIIQKILKAYSRKGYHTLFIGWNRLQEQTNSSNVQNSQTDHIMHGWGYSNWKLLLGLPLWGLRLIWRCLRLDTDLIHVLDFDSGFSVAIINWLRGIPFIYDIQDNFGQRHHWPFPLNVMIRYLDDWTASRAAGILVTDENRIVGFLEKYRHKTIIIPNCAPDIRESCSFPNQDLNSTDEDISLTVMALGNLSEQRGIGLLLDAVEQLPDVRVLMAGRFVGESLKQRALGMPQVDFRGWLPMEEALCLSLQADVIFTFYDPSIEINRRASSNKWYDAMMLAKPVLANNELLKSSWIDEKEFGFLCPYGDVKALVQCLRHIQTHPEEAARRGKIGRSLYESEFNWPVMQGKILDMVRDILSNY